MAMREASNSTISSQRLAPKCAPSYRLASLQPHGSCLAVVQLCCNYRPSAAEVADLTACLWQVPWQGQRGGRIPVCNAQEGQQEPQPVQLAQQGADAPGQQGEPAGTEPRGLWRDSSHHHQQVRAAGPTAGVTMSTPDITQQQLNVPYNCHILQSFPTGGIESESRAWQQLTVSLPSALAGMSWTECVQLRARPPRSSLRRARQLLSSRQRLPRPWPRSARGAC